MKNLFHSKNIPCFTLILGIIAAALRWLLYELATDEKNLIPLGHPLEILLWIVSAATLALILTAILPLRNAENSPNRFAPNLAAGLGALAAAVGIGLTVLLHSGDFSGTLGLIRRVLGIAAAASLLAVAFYRARGQAPFFGLHAIVCIFFAVHMVSCYRLWSGNPQLMDYIFSLFACIGMMLFAFYHGCLEAGMGKLRLLPVTGLLTAYCCIVALSGTDYSMLYLGGGIWSLTNLCRLHTGE